MPGSALTIEEGTAKLHVEDIGVVDNLQFGGPGQIFTTVSFDVTWTSFGEVLHFRPGSSVPTDPSNFAGRFRFANATATFSGSRSGFSFGSTDASSAGMFAEMGKERNGVFLHEEDEE